MARTDIPVDLPEIKEDEEEIDYEVTIYWLAGARSRRAIEQVLMLWLGVLVRGIVDWVLYRKAVDVKKRELWEDANHWIFQDGSSEIGSFTMTCEILELRPWAIRKRIGTLTKEDVAKLRRRRR